VNAAVRILIVEDQERIRMLLAEALVQAGYDVSECSDSESAMTWLDGTSHVAAVILDWILEGVPAEAVLLRVLAHPSRPGCVITSGYRLGPPALTRESSGRIVQVEKPFTPQMIRDALASLGV
jgi:DNA-binding NtrC family response regulator